MGGYITCRIHGADSLLDPRAGRMGQYAIERLCYDRDDGKDEDRYELCAVIDHMLRMICDISF